MRVTPDEFLSYILEHTVDVEPVGFARDFGVHHDQQQQVAEFFAKICAIVGAHRASHFVCLFDQGGQQRFMGLLVVPGTAAGSAKLCDNFAKFFKLSHSEQSPFDSLRLLGANSAESKNPAAFFLGFITDSSTSLGMTFKSARANGACRTRRFRRKISC